MTSEGIRLANVATETDTILLEISKYDFLWCIGGNRNAGAIDLITNLNYLRVSNYGEFINK